MEWDYALKYFYMYFITQKETKEKTDKQQQPKKQGC